MKDRILSRNPMKIKDISPKSNVVKILAFFIFCVVFNISTFGQLSTLYSYSYSGTNLNVYNSAPTILQATNTVGNDAVFTSQAIGFTFKFNCIDYTTIGISGNGFIWFGSGTCASNQYTPLSSTVGETGTVAGIVSGFGANLASHANGASPARTLNTKLTGASPNRVFTIEWRKTVMSGAATNPVDVQIKLFETSNNIEIRLFDNSYFLSGSSAIGQVGIRTTTTDFLNRTTSGGNLCTTSSGVTNTATCSIVPMFACDYAYSGSGAITFKYDFTGPCCTFPTVQPSSGTVSPISVDNATLNWTPGNGTGADIVFLKEGSAITTDPTDNTIYTSNSIFGTGNQIGATGAFAVYNGSAGSVSVTNLLPNTTYYYKIYSYNSAGPCYLKPSTLMGSFTTSSCTTPTVQPSLATLSCIDFTTMNLRFTRGNGTRAIVVARAGSNVNADPVYNTIYSANANFGSGSQIGLGNYVVYDGNDVGLVTVPLTGLNPSTTYYFKIYEYNSPTNCYNVTAPAMVNATTRGEGNYGSNTTTQNATNVAPGALAQDIVKLNIVISSGNDLAATLNNIVFTTTGSTNAANDITNAKIFYTGSTNSFSNATQYGATFTSFVGSLTATANFALLAGNNYFWIAYDVKPTATGGNVLDATVTSFNLTDGSGTANYTPTPTAPAGSRLIAAPASLVFCGGVTPLAVANGSGCNYSCSQGENLSSITIAGATTLSFSGWPCNGDCANSQRSYTDMFNLNKYSMLQGTTHNMSISFSTWFSMQMNWVLWVDWNQDGVFTNASPERFPTTGSIDEWTSQNIVVPASVSSGRHRARLWIQEFSATISTPCNTAPGPFTTSLGQIVDFDIEVPDGSLPDLDPVAASGAVSCATLAPGIVTPINYTLGDPASQLSATGTGLLWYTSPTGGIGSSTAPTPSASATGTTTYYVSQTNSSGTPICEGPRIQIAVNVIPPPMPLAPIATVTQPTCTDATGSIEISGLPASGTWTINPNLISGTGTTNTISPVSTGTYSYTVTDQFGCISPSSIPAIVNPQPPLPDAPIIGLITQPTGSIPTGSVDLSGLPVDTWTVNPGNISGLTGVTTTTVSGLSPGTYTFTVTNADGCTSLASLNVLISEVLPIELLSFDGKCDGRALVFRWSTASEHNNEYFTIEKSKDIVNWSAIGVVAGAGNSTFLQEYSLTDQNYSTEFSYFRLRQTDSDGQFKFSEIIYVANCSETEQDFIVAPNPTSGIFNVFFQGDIHEVTSVKIFTISGELIYESDVFESTYNLSDKTDGIYFFQLNTISKTLNQKVIIEK